MIVPFYRHLNLRRCRKMVNNLFCIDHQIFKNLHHQEWNHKENLRSNSWLNDHEDCLPSAKKQNYIYMYTAGLVGSATWVIPIYPPPPLRLGFFYKNPLIFFWGGREAGDKIKTPDHKILSLM